MNRASIFEVITTVAVKLKPNAQVEENSLFKEDLNFDSLDTINFFFEVEMQTGIQIDENAIADENLISVSHLLNYLERKAA